MNLMVVKTDIARKIAGIVLSAHNLEIVFGRDGQDCLLTLLTELIT